MFKVSMFFFILALVSYLLGLTGFANLNMEIGRLVLFIFIFGAIISFAIGLLNDGKHDGPRKN